MMMNQIEEWEQEDPDDIHKVPVQSHHFHRRVILGTEVQTRCADEDPDQKTDTDDHVQRVEPCQTPVEDHEQLHLWRELRVLVPGEAIAGEKTLSPVRVILDSLDDEERQSERHGEEQHDLERTLPSELG